MSQEFNVDELEALLGDLDGGTPPTTTIDADVSDAVIVEEAPAETPKPRTSRTPKRNLKAIPQEKIDEQRGPSDDDLASLEGLDDDTAAVTTAEPALTSATEAVTAAEDLGDLTGLEDLDTTPETVGTAVPDDLPFEPDEVAPTPAPDDRTQISLEDLDALAAGGDLDEAEVPAGAIVVDADKLDKIKNAGKTLAEAGLTAAITEETTVRADANTVVATKVTEAGTELDIDVDALLKESGGEAVAISVAPGASTPVTAPGSKSVGATGSGSSKPAPSMLSYVPSAPLKTFVDPQRLDEDLSFSTTNLSMAMTRQAALFAHYSRLAAEATYQADRAKQQVELAEAELDQTFRDSLTAAGTKFTEAMIKSMIIKDSGYQAAQSRAYEAKAIGKMIGSAADSFDHRKDMLIQCGADAREEKKGNLRMKEHPGEAAVAAMEKQ